MIYLIFKRKNSLAFELRIDQNERKYARRVSTELVCDDDVLELQLVAVKVEIIVKSLYIVLKAKQREFVEKLNVEMGKQEKS